MSLEEMRRELLKAAVRRKTVTYGHLMSQFGLSRGESGKTVVGMLSEIDREEYKVGAPGFAALVVRKDTGYPGGGFFCWDDVPTVLRRPPEKCQDPKLSPAERVYIEDQQERIWRHYATQVNSTLDAPLQHADGETLCEPRSEHRDNDLSGTKTNFR